MKKLSKNFKSKTIIVANLFLIITLMTVSVYSWFATHVNNAVDANNIEVVSDNSIELSFTGAEGTWSGGLDLNALTKDDGSKVFDSLRLVEMTGDGETFKIPSLQQYSNYAEVVINNDWRTPEVNKDYLKFDVHVRSKDHLGIFLSSSSAATPSSSLVTGSGCGNAVDETFAKGANAFSKDCIVGALRVSYENINNKRYIWIPCPQYHLENTVGSDTYAMKTNATASKYTDLTPEDGTPYAWNSSYNHYYYTAGDKNAGVLPVFNSTFANDIAGTLPETVSKIPVDEKNFLVELTYNSTTEYYEGVITFTIWIEGCDTEARKALVGGKFNLSLVIDAVPYANVSNLDTT